MEVECRTQGNEYMYTVCFDTDCISFYLDGVKFGELHSSAQGAYIAKVRKYFKKKGIKVHGPTLAFHLKSAT